MKLFIVESPGKVKKIQEFLGTDYKVAASVGHIRDLPANEMGVEAPDYTPQYVPTERGKEVIGKLKTLASECSEVYLATDPDREGEAIAWHLQDALKLKNPKRVTYTAITESDIKKGINNATSIDMNLVKAQEARRVLDRFFGYMISYPLTNAVGEKMTSGRVQSPAVRLVVERERAIKAFKSTTYYAVELLFESAEQKWKATWNSDNFLEDNQEYILDKSLAEKIATIKDVKVSEYSETEKKQAPPAPFTTSTLQQASNSALKLSPKATMQVAQKLYEAGHITYMRTDSPNLSEEAINEIFDYCDTNNLEHVEKARTWKSKESAQEAHEAIRPTHFEVENISGSVEEQKLYELIRLRAIASQMLEAVFSVRNLKLLGDVDGKEAFFEAQGKTIVFHGWKTLFDVDAGDEENMDDAMENPIPSFDVDTELSVSSASVLTKKTQAPGRYNQASLIKTLEKQGIGRPATYASILDNILEREYIKEEKRKLFATEKGEKLIKALVGAFKFIELNFTTEMEENLDKIAMGKLDYTSVVSQASEEVTAELESFENTYVGTTYPCSKCGGTLRKRTGKNGAFWGCSSYPECKEIFEDDNDKPVEREKFTCPECQGDLTRFKAKTGKFCFACFAKENHANGSVLFWDDDKGKPVFEAKKETIFKCPECKQDLKRFKAKTGNFCFACFAKENHANGSVLFWDDAKGKPVFNLKTNKK